MMEQRFVAREYEIPKKPNFLLDDMHLLQSSDAATFALDSVLDSIMYSSNGNIGLRHRSGLETVDCTTEILMNGVYHTVPMNNAMDTTLFSKTRELGAVVGMVSVDCRIDGVSGTLSSMPLQRLNMRNGSYRNVCQNALSFDAGLYFDTKYTRCVSLSDLSLWGMELVCTNLRFRAPGATAAAAHMEDKFADTNAARGGQWAGMPDMGNFQGDNRKTTTTNNNSSNQHTNSRASSTNYLGSNSCTTSSSYESGFDMGSHSASSSTNNTHHTTARLSPMLSQSRPLPTQTYKLEMVISFSIELDEWEVSKANRMDEFWQRSFTSNVAVSTTTSASCVVEYRTHCTKLEAEVEYHTECDEKDSDHLGLTRGRLSSISSNNAGNVAGGSNSNTANSNHPHHANYNLSHHTNSNMYLNHLHPTAASAAMGNVSYDASMGHHGTSADARGGSSSGLSGDGAGLGSSTGLYFRDTTFGGGAMTGMGGVGNYGTGGMGGRYCCATGSYPHRRMSLAANTTHNDSGAAGSGACTGGVGHGCSNITSSHYSHPSHYRNSSFDLLVNGPNSREVHRLTVKKRFTVMISPDNVPRVIRLSLFARHHTDKVALPPPTPCMRDLLATQRAVLGQFWRTFDVHLQLQDELIPHRARLPLLYNAFRLFSVSPNLRAGLPRAGCSQCGEGLRYDLGRYLFLGLYYTLTQPSAALALLYSIHQLLPEARRNARHLSLPHGALYPANTLTGKNRAAYTSILSARFYVNADIGYMIQLYLAAAQPTPIADRLMLLETLLETARVWPQLGCWSAEDATMFVLDAMSGPDEYNRALSGNFYVHLLAKQHMLAAVDLLHTCRSSIGESRVHALMGRIALTWQEVEEMERVARGVCVRRDDTAGGVFMTHDSFHALAPTRSGLFVQHPLHHYYHPLTIYRTQVVDIPEVLLAMILYETLFTQKDFEQNYQYYMPLCALDSPVALGVLAIAQCRAHHNFAQPLPFLRSLSCIDLENLTFAASEGLHFDAMAMSLVTLLCGLGGVGFSGDALYVNPILPAGVSRYGFTVHWRGATLRTTVDTDHLTFEMIAGDSLRFIHTRSQNRIHLHTGYRRVQAVHRCVIHRSLSHTQRRPFDGVIVMAECMFNSLLEYSYLAWLRTLERLFDSYRVLQNKHIPSLNPEEFISKVVYQVEEGTIAFSGIDAVLRDRNIVLDLGTTDDAEIVETRHGLANAKVAEMAELLAQHKPQVNSAVVNMLQAIRRSGAAMASVTYSRNLRSVLACYPELADFFVAHVGGEEALERGIRGRPHLDLYLKAADIMHVDPRRCVVIAFHLDRGLWATELARFRMFLDLEDPFVSSRVKPHPYPTLSDADVVKHGRDNPVVSRLYLDRLPTTADAMEDVVDCRYARE